MKNPIFLLLAVFLAFTSVVKANESNSMAISTKDSVKTASFKVYGNCGMCKSRIEKAAKIEGVKSAEWNKSTKEITIKYDLKKVTEEAIHKAIATAGHDTEKLKATDEAYNSLHGCCQYERSK